MIAARSLTKRYGDITAVDDVSFTIQPGMVTGFLGRNGAGKSTTMRMIVGLHAPTSGTVTISGLRYRDLPVPLRELGALLDAKAVHPGMTARDHLRCLATANGIRASRVDEVLELVGLGHVAKRRTGSFSLGMGQRLGIAATLLGDPPIIMLDEPLNGLDPDGVHWLRSLLRGLADEGRTVFLSSHLMSEMALIADRIVVLHEGRLIADTTLGELLVEHSDRAVQVRVETPSERGMLMRRLAEASATSSPVPVDDTGIVVRGVDPAQVGREARDLDIALTELTTREHSLEDVFLEITDWRPADGRPADRGRADATRKAAA